MAINCVRVSVCSLTCTYLLFSCSSPSCFTDNVYAVKVLVLTAYDVEARDNIQIITFL